VRNSIQIVRKCEQNRAKCELRLYVKYSFNSTDFHETRACSLTSHRPSIYSACHEYQTHGSHAAATLLTANGQQANRNHTHTLRLSIFNVWTNTA